MLCKKVCHKKWKQTQPNRAEHSTGNTRALLNLIAQGTDFKAPTRCQIETWTLLMITTIQTCKCPLDKVTFY